VFACRGSRVASGPLGLAFDRFGNLYVANISSNTIREFSPTGQDLGIFASTGLGFPAGLVVERSGNLFVAHEEQRPGQIDYSIRE
jgi:DNA-binding beta-propeller fold protein YncE